MKFFITTILLSFNVITTSSNSANGYFSNVAGGRLNEANGDYSFIGGGYNNSINGKFSGIIGGSNNKILAPTSFIFGSNGFTSKSNTMLVALSGECNTNVGNSMKICAKNGLIVNDINISDELLHLRDLVISAINISSVYEEMVNKSISNVYQDIDLIKEGHSFTYSLVDSMQSNIKYHNETVIKNSEDIIDLQNNIKDINRTLSDQISFLNSKLNINVKNLLNIISKFNSSINDTLSILGSDDIVITDESQIIEQKEDSLKYVLLGLFILTVILFLINLVTILKIHKKVFKTDRVHISQPLEKVATPSTPYEQNESQETIINGPKTTVGSKQRSLKRERRRRRPKDDIQVNSV